MHHLGAAVPVRQVVGEHLGVGEGPRELLDACRVRPVAAPDEERLRIEPERVAAVDRPGPHDHAHNRNAGALEVDLQRERLAEAPVLARAEEHGALLAHEHRVVGVDRVGVPALALGDDHLRARTLEDLSQSPVLGRRGGDVGLGAPAVLLPALGVLRLRRAHEHPPERRGHRTSAVACHGRQR